MEYKYDFPEWTAPSTEPVMTIEEFNRLVSMRDKLKMIIEAYLEHASKTDEPFVITMNIETIQELGLEDLVSNN